MPKDLTVAMADRPGTLAKASAALGAAGVNLLGGCGVATGVGPQVHWLVKDGDVGRAKAALASAGASISGERDALVIDVAHKAGGLAGAIKPLADAWVNVNLFYLTEDGRLVVGVDDMAKARAALA